MLRPSRKTLSFLLIILAVAFVALAGVAFWWEKTITVIGPLDVEKTVLIQKGTSVATMSNILKTEQVIDNKDFFRVLVRLNGLSSSLQAGEYVFTPEISLKEVVDMLAKGQATDRKVLFHEGMTVAEILVKIQGLDMKGDVPKSLPEGSLFPDTYAYTVGGARTDLVEKMQRNAAQALQMAWASKSLENPLKSPAELLILASIVQKEAGNTQEMPKIAGVFINRMKRGMKLQADSTAIYGILARGETYNGNLTTRHLRAENPYNTYTIEALPAGPIATVGNAALMAAAMPDTHPYLYFVVDGTQLGSGRHVFSRTYAEHAQNVATYVQAYRAKYGKK